MPTFDPDKEPKKFVTLLVAAGLFIFKNNIANPKDAFERAKEFADESEKQIGTFSFRP